MKVAKYYLLNEQPIHIFSLWVSLNPVSWPSGQEHRPPFISTSVWGEVSVGKSGQWLKVATYTFWQTYLFKYLFIIIKHFSVLSSYVTANHTFDQKTPHWCNLYKVNKSKTTYIYQSWPTTNKWSLSGSFPNIKWAQSIPCEHNHTTLSPVAGSHSCAPGRGEGRRQHHQIY